MLIAELPFIDVEADRSGRVLAIGAVRGERTLHLELPSSEARSQLLSFLEGAPVVAGHNLHAFDAPLLAEALDVQLPSRLDTLRLSLLAWPERMGHALPKPSPAEMPDPVADARQSRELALDAAAELERLAPEVAILYAALLALGEDDACRLALPATGPVPSPVEALAQWPDTEQARLCRIHLEQLVHDFDPDDAGGLVFALRFIARRATLVEHGDHQELRLLGPPSPALTAVPRCTALLTRLLGPLCPDPGCRHRTRCQVHRPFAEEILQRNFDLPSFRPGQEEIVQAVLGDRCPLVILPTGGGKSLCYQLPAVHGGERLHGLTVVVSPLQALMADQVRALSTRYPPSCFINSSLLMGERSEHLHGLRTGKYNVLYIGPEQLRNPSMMSLLRNRPPFLWIVDEAHCISQWGHNFRTDYTYLPRAIASIHGDGRRPLMALFTATATRDVQGDIALQMDRSLGAVVTLMDFGARRENLRYEVTSCRDGQHKRNELVRLIRATEGARLVYCATTRQVEECAEYLQNQGIDCTRYHGRLSPADKREHLQAFLGGKQEVIVATSAFGMGIDKPDIRLVVHYEIPGSLEDYVQETGRAGRDGERARCVLLFLEEDLDVQFFLKTATRITERDLRFVFHALRRRARRFRRHAREDGWVDLWVSAEDLFVEESLEEKLDWSSDTLHHKLKLVLHHLESDGVLQRLENRTRTLGIFPRCADLATAEAKLRAHTQAPNPGVVRVLHYLYDPDRPPRVSVLDIADACALSPRRAFGHVQALTSMDIVGQDLAFEITFAQGVARPSHRVAYEQLQVARGLFEIGTELDEAPVLRIRSAAAEIGRRLARRVPPHRVVNLLRALRRQGWLRLDKLGPDTYRVRFEPGAIEARDRLRRAERVSGALFEYLGDRLAGVRGRDLVTTLDVATFVQRPTLTEKLSHDETVATCLLLHHLDAWHLADPPVLFDTAMRVRFDPATKLQRVDRARPRRQHQHEIQLVHMMREYAVTPPGKRQVYVDDYFRLSGEDLAEKYFRGRKRAIVRAVSVATERKLLEGLTNAQREAVTTEERAVLVVAGPGSGKTHTVVQRISHMVRARQIRADHILVLAFNRSAAAELRVRLRRAIGERAGWVDIRTFHSLAIKLTGAELFTNEDPEARLDEAMVEAAALLTSEDDADRERATHLRQQILGGVRHVLVDEYQDLDPTQYQLLAALVGLDPKRRGIERTERSVYVVGDDDQAIYGFRKASVAFLRRFEEDFSARRICLRDNFRSHRPIVAAAQSFIARASDRLKTSPDEQMRPGPQASPGDERSVRRLSFSSPEELAAHVAYGIERRLPRAGTIAVVARHWSHLDPVRFVLEAADVEAAIHHRDHRLPLHRRHPVAFILDRLWRRQAPLTTSAVLCLEGELTRLKRGQGEPVVQELMRIGREIDDERERTGRLPFFGRAPRRYRPPEKGQLQLVAAETTPLLRGGSVPEPMLAPMTTAELADAIVLASRDDTRRGRNSREASVHLATIHGAKGLEFDQVIVLPCLRRRDPEERRAYYVAMTRAREELSLCCIAVEQEYAGDVSAPTLDLRGVSSKLGVVEASYLDASPADVRLSSRVLRRSQTVISRLVEGEPLDIDDRGDEVHLRAGPATVATLSRAGRARLRAMKSQKNLRARVREVYQHLERDDAGKVSRGWLVVLPTLLAGEHQRPSRRS